MVSRMTKKISLLWIALGTISLSILLPITLIVNINSNLNENNLLSINSEKITKTEKILTKDLATILVNDKLAMSNWNGHLVEEDFETYTSIGESAFEGNQNITSITLPLSITSIGMKSFSNLTLLKNIVLPGVTSIGSSAFSNLPKLTTIELPVVRNISENAFIGATSLKSINFPSATNVASGAFTGASSLTTIDLPLVTTIGPSAFMGATSLITIDLPSAKTIGPEAFKGINVTSISAEQATLIGAGAFSNLSKLTSINLPNASNIDQNAFTNATSLEFIELPKAVSIGDGAFKGGTNLKVIELLVAENIGIGAFSGNLNIVKSGIRLTKNNNIHLDKANQWETNTDKLDLSGTSYPIPDPPIPPIINNPNDIDWIFWGSIIGGISFLLIIGIIVGILIYRKKTSE